MDDEEDNLLELRPLVAGDEAAFLEAVAEFRRHEPKWDFALGYEAGLRFADYVQRMEAWSRGERLPPGYVRGGFYVAVVGGKVVGRVSIRHELNVRLAVIGGHIGYGVVPSARRRGYATEMLRRALTICGRELGLARVLVTCDETNEGSRKTIERCGGEFEGFAEEPGNAVRTRRYWIPTCGEG